MAGGKGDRLHAVGAQHDQLGVGRVAVDDQQVEDGDGGGEDLQLLLQVRAGQVWVCRVHQDLHHLAAVGADEEDVKALAKKVLGTLELDRTQSLF